MLDLFSYEAKPLGREGEQVQAGHLGEQPELAFKGEGIVVFGLVPDIIDRYFSGRAKWLVVDFLLEHTELKGLQAGQELLEVFHSASGVLDSLIVDNSYGKRLPVNSEMFTSAFAIANDI
ncbi:hypothetical protein ACSX1A_10860 [Pontibacter sp. MBLB2868]|uniref:hypothetical protein n=1 Tax=Pontibacter sp. MBLB2868 TaxID=3451555 RepID=UPI003F756A31